MSPSGWNDVVDRPHLARAIDLAECGRLGARPNPVVGAVLARGDEVLAEGWHARAGEAHAERIALERIDDVPQLATLYVTLEPCAHTGRQPPCADLVIARGVRRVVIASHDPSVKTAGRGPDLLERTGVEVVWAPADLCALATRQNAGFQSWHRRGRPWVIAKWAMTRNGRVATGDPQRRWISGVDSRAVVQRMRAEAGAIIVGVGTVLVDDPRLTVRGDLADEVLGQPLRVVFDRSLRTPLGCSIVRSAANVPTLLIAGADAPARREAELRAHGVDVWHMPDPGGEVGLRAALAEIGRRTVFDVLVEAGPTLTRALYDAGLIDAICCFTAPFDAPADQPGFAPAEPLLVALDNARSQQVGVDRMIELDLATLDAGPNRRA